MRSGLRLAVAGAVTGRSLFVVKNLYPGAVPTAVMGATGEASSW